MTLPERLRSLTNFQVERFCLRNADPDYNRVASAIHEAADEIEAQTRKIEDYHDEVTYLWGLMDAARKVSEEYDPSDRTDPDSDAHILRRAFNKALQL